jgi:hypothetical protein
MKQIRDCIAESRRHTEIWRGSTLGQTGFLGVSLSDRFFLIARLSLMTEISLGNRAATGRT